MSTNAIVPVVPNQDAALLAQGGLGLDGDALKPELMIMTQPTTKDLPKGTPSGVFFDKSSGETWETVRFVPLKMHLIRDKYPSKTYKPGDKATCKSRNGLVPITNSQFLVPEAPNCQVCEFSKWDNTSGKTGKEAAPQCKEGYLITFIDFETKLPFFIKLSGLSVKVGKKLKDAIARQAVMANAKNPGGAPVNLFDYVVEMTAVQAGDSTAYMVNFPRVQRMTPEKSAEFGPLYMQLVAHRQRLADERAAAAKNEEAVNGAVDEIVDAEYEDIPAEI